MVEIDLTNSDLFKNLIEFEARGVSIDLHNEYTCHSIDFDNKNDNFNLRFKLDNNSAGKINQVDIAFANCL